MAAKKKVTRGSKQASAKGLTLHGVYFTPEAVEKIIAMSRRPEPKGCHMVVTPGDGNTWTMECRGNCPAGSTGCSLEEKDGHWWCACGKTKPPNVVFTP